VLNSKDKHQPTLSWIVDLERSVESVKQLTSAMTSARGATEGELAEAEAALSLAFPEDFSEFARASDGAEGFVGGAYLALWPVSEIASLNTLARTAHWAPGIVLFGTNAGGDGYGFRDEGRVIVRVPMIGMSPELVEVIGESFRDFVRWLAALDPQASGHLQSNPTTKGLIVHEIHPVILGGDPTSPSNKTLLPLDRYLEAVAFWNSKLATHGH
jgi:SMI1 / KNR4 family (SUKH-1)